jgi:hypothetical protein
MRRADLVSMGIAYDGLASAHGMARMGGDQAEIFEVQECPMSPKTTTAVSNLVWSNPGGGQISTAHKFGYERGFPMLELRSLSWLQEFRELECKGPPWKSKYGSRARSFHLEWF